MHFVLLDSSAGPVLSVMVPLGSPSVMNMFALLVQCMFAIAYGENKFMLFQMKGLVWGTRQALLRSRRGRNVSWDGLLKFGWVHCLQYTVNCFQYNVCGLCWCEPSNHYIFIVAKQLQNCFKFCELKSSNH